jgi:hypothetical protein
MLILLLFLRQISQLAVGLKLYHDFFWHIYWLSCARVKRSSGFSLFGRKSAETSEDNLVSLLQVSPSPKKNSYSQF